MRDAVRNPERVYQFLNELGRRARPGDRAYISGGASAVISGWREFTQDIDLRLEAANDLPLFQAIAELKNSLDINVETAGPLDFLPEPPGWRDHSPYIGRFGNLDAFHSDFSLQALAKLERGFAHDLRDVNAMLQRGLTTKERIAETYAAIEPDLVRFPAIDHEAFRGRVDQLTTLGYIPRREIDGPDISGPERGHGIGD